MAEKLKEFEAAEVLQEMSFELIGAAALAQVLGEMFMDEKSRDLYDFFITSSFGFSALSNDDRNSLANLDKILEVAALIRKFYEVNFDGLKYKERNRA